MKKAIILIILLSMTLMLTGCDFEVDDSEKRTYDYVVYDKAYYRRKSEGVKCSSYIYYLFNESDNIVLKYILYTCGEDTVTENKGTWVGNLEKEATLYFEIDGKEVEEKVTFDEYNMYDENKTEYDEEDIKIAASNLRIWTPDYYG